MFKRDKFKQLGFARVRAAMQRVAIRAVYHRQWMINTFGIRGGDWQDFEWHCDQCRGYTRVLDLMAEVARELDQPKLT